MFKRAAPFPEPRTARPAAGAPVTDGRRSRLRVLMIVESSSGGTGRHVLDLSEGLARRGCDVHVLYSTGRTDRFFLDRMRRLSGVRCAALPMRTSIHPSDFSAVRAARRYLNEFGPFDLVHGHSSKGGAVARLAAIGKGLPAFYTLHGFIIMDPLLARWKRALYLLIELALSLRTETIIAVAPEERREAVRMGLGSDRVTLIPNGVGTRDLAPRQVVRRAMGVNDDTTPVVGFVGRLVAQKAPELLLRAMRRVADACPNARLAMVGAGPLERELHELVRSLGIAGQTLWLGERPADSVLAGFDVFAMPSRKEGLPYVVLEAMAAGLPVVATDSAGVGSLVETGVNGIVVPRGDADAFGMGLTTIATDLDLRNQYGRASSERIAASTVDQMVEQTMAAYQEAVAARLPLIASSAELALATAGAGAETL